MFINVFMGIYDQILEMVIEEDHLIDWICGIGGCRVASDPRDRDSGHAFHATQYFLHKYLIEHPEQNSNKLYFNEITYTLNTDCGGFYVYCIFRSLQAQMEIQKDRAKVAFILERGEVVTVLKLIKEKMQVYKDCLTNAIYEFGSWYSDGIYGYLNYAIDRMCQELQIEL